jgi:hypothetical protein
MAVPLAIAMRGRQPAGRALPLLPLLLRSFAFSPLPPWRWRDVGHLADYLRFERELRALSDDPEQRLAGVRDDEA